MIITIIYTIISSQFLVMEKWRDYGLHTNVLNKCDKFILLDAQYHRVS